MRILPRLLPLALLFAAIPLQADDWPQWRGPQRDSVSQETGLLAEWPKEGPKLLWQRTDIHSGYATPAVVGDRIYVLSNEGLENEFVQARDVRDGSRVWQTHLGAVGNPKQQPNYPAARSTPTVDGDVLFALSSDGDLVCLELAGGAVRWQKNLRTDFAGNPGTWAYSESPLVDGEKVICSPGGSEAGMIALNKKDGAVIWKCAVSGGGSAAYTSPILVQAGGIRQYVQTLEKTMVGVDAATGAELWRYDKAIGTMGGNIPSPLGRGDLVYSAGNGRGGSTARIKKGDDGKIMAEQVYFSPKLPTSIGGAVVVGNLLFGTSASTLLCVDFNTGEVKWEERALGPASLCSADGRLYLHGENGDVALVEPSAAGYREKGRFTPPSQPKRLNQMEKAWAYPVIANGRLYIRDQNSLWCYDVRAVR
jgi:outer membrane protein assembly factor BamB